MDFRKPPWSSRFNITTGPHECAPEQVSVRDNRWCYPRQPPPPPPPAGANASKCVQCPASHPAGYGGETGHFCCSVPLSGRACNGHICCLEPGSVKVTKFGQHGCQGLGRCGNNPRNLTACKPNVTQAPRFTDYFDMVKVHPNSSAWGNVLANNVRFFGCG